MSKLVRTLGGDRVGSGNRMKQEMHNFYRSNKNLSKTWASTMAPGVLYPAYVNWALKGDTFDIDINTFVRTVPTIGPLYGSFKLQLDFYQVPVRLYQGILHNNTTDIARKMNQVYFPQIQLKSLASYDSLNEKWIEQINPTALLRYLNIKGLGRHNSINYPRIITREFNAVPMLAYYDIFKNYYANKQEENAYVISPKEVIVNQSVTSIVGKKTPYLTQCIEGTITSENTIRINTSPLNNDTNLSGFIQFYIIKGTNLDPKYISLQYSKTDNNDSVVSTYFSGTLDNLQENGNISIKFTDNNTLQVYIEPDDIPSIDKAQNGFQAIFQYDKQYAKSVALSLNEFPLSNIDDMRKYLLTRWDLGQKSIISDENQDYLPYSALTTVDSDLYSYNKYALNGLVVKCYQSDLFNNWLDTEWVNEITSASAVNIVDGSFTIDALNFKKKLYDHLNRLAISGGTYDDWQAATYGEEVWGKSEKPIYCGGMSSEVVFDEVVSTAASGEDPLGTIGGRGTLNGRKGGKITIKVGEASVIMAIVSLTPRLFYTQGNAWYNTELVTMDDLHKPIFDRIGFQDLIIEQMAWWDATTEDDGKTYQRTSAGKQPAWINYATDYDEAYGDFAREEGINYMILARNYESKEGNVSDVTTYIDPAKFNYAFAYSAIDAQNFWTFINYKIHARRKMSNTQIPNV